MAIITLDDIKDRLKITSTDDDTQLTSIINGVSNLVTGYCNQSFTSVVAYDEYYDIDADHTTFFRLDHYPVVTFTSLYNDDDLLTSDEYDVYTSTGIVRTDAVTFVVGNKTMRAIYTAGYSTPPDEIKEVVLQLSVMMYNRSGSLGIKSEKVGDYSITYNDPFFIKYSTEWNLYKNILDNYRTDTPC